MTSKQSITVVVPCYNEADVLPLLYERLRNLSLEPEYRIDFVLVDDGSTDDTWSQISAICTEREGWKGIRLSRNFGHQRALWSGFQQATGDAVFVLDADLQDPPEKLRDFVEQWKNGHQVVYGVRTKRKESVWKKIAYKSFYRILARVADIEIPLDSGDFCLMDRQVVDAMLQSNETTPFIRGIRAWVGFRQVALEYERNPRAAGREKYSLAMLVELAINGVFGFSRKPLRMITWSGLLVFGLGGMIALGFLLSIVLNASVPGDLGWMAAGMAGLSLSTGLILTSIGIVGEYVGRVFESASARPVSFVSEISERPSDSPSRQENQFNVDFFRKRAA